MSSGESEAIAWRGEKSPDPVLGPIAWTFRKTMAAFEREIGMIAARYFILDALSLRDGVSQGEIWQHFDIDPSRVTRLAKSLEADGLVRRQRDPEDNRVVRVYLTEKGRSTYDELAEKRARFQRRIDAAVSERDVEDLDRILGRLIEAVGETEENEDIEREAVR